MKTKTIKQSVTFAAKPEEVYHALMDSKMHSKFTGSKASIGKGVGGKFTSYDGSIRGTNLELVPGKKIVQAWTIDDQGWPPGEYSQITLEFGKTKTGTQMKFTHTGVPKTAYANIKQGWIDYFWNPMKEMFSKNKLSSKRREKT